MAALYPEDFQGAAPAGVDIICLSSDEEEEMYDLSMISVLDLQLSSEDEEIDDEIMMMAQCVEMQLSSPIPVPGPPSTLKIRNEAPQYSLPRYGTSGTSFTARPTLDQSFSHWGEEMAQYGETTECATIILSKCVGKSFPWWILLCRPHLKSKDQLTSFTQWTVKAELPNSPWTRLQTIFKEWEFRRTIQWQITQTV